MDAFYHFMDAGRPDAEPPTVEDVQAALQLVARHHKTSKHKKKKKNKHKKKQRK